jgi:signal transduction histidine kinase
MILLILLAMGCNSFFAQSSQKVDSLMMIAMGQQEDTNKVKALNALSKLLYESNPYAEVKRYAEEALRLAIKFDFKRGMAEAYMNLGLLEAGQDNYTEAVQYQTTSLRIYESIGDKQEIASAHRKIGLLYWRLGNYDLAMQNHQASLKLFEEIKNKTGIGNAYNNIGLIYEYQGNYPEALKYYLESYKIAEELQNRTAMDASLTNLGLIYSTLGNYTEALKCHIASLDISKELGDQSNLAIAYLNISNDYDIMGDYNVASIYLDSTIIMAEKSGSESVLTVAYSMSGAIHADLGKYDEALKDYLTQLSLLGDSEDQEQIIKCWLNIGMAYTRLNHFSEANEYLQKGLLKAEATGLENVKKDAYKAISDLYTAVGNSDEALVYYKKYVAFKDSLQNESNTREFALIKEQYESEKKDREILTLTNEKQLLEREKQINALLLKSKQDSLHFAQTEKEKTQLENEKFEALNLFNQQQLVLLNNEKQLHLLQIEKDKSDYIAQKAISDQKQEQLTVLTKEKSIQDFALKKQKQAKNFFLAGLVLLLILSLFVYKNYRTRQELKLQSLRNKIASDLHDDIGSTLTSISFFSQMAQAQSKEVIPALETIGESSRRMLDAMADIVWSINPENDEFERVIMRMRGFAFDLLGASNIDFEFDADEEVEKIKLPMEARKNLYLIFKEATNNMVKYAEADKAMFALKGEKDKLTMMIQDNGKGFDTSKESYGNGLKNMKKRAVEMRAQLWIDSMPGEGTTIKLELAV